MLDPKICLNFPGWEKQLQLLVRGQLSLLVRSLQVMLVFFKPAPVPSHYYLQATDQDLITRNHSLRGKAGPVLGGRLGEKILRVLDQGLSLWHCNRAGRCSPGIQGVH